MPCQKCDRGWGLVDGRYCECEYGQKLKAARKRQWEEEDAAWLALIRAGAKIPSKYRDAKLEDFTRVQRDAVWAARDKAQGLYVWGPVGTGKTHLAAAVLNGELERGLPGYWMVVPDWLEDIRATFNTTDSAIDVMDRPLYTRLLVMDDLGVEKPSAWVQEQLYRLVNGRYQAGRETIITSNASLAELAERIGDRTCSRIAEMCVAMRLAGKDRRVQR